MSKTVGERVIFTNGCFDLLHVGHIQLINTIKSIIPNSYLIIGINSDDSVRRIKGKNRPIYSENNRREMLLSIKGVDEVIIFDETTPSDLIRKIKPDIIIKGDDYYKENVIGFDSTETGLLLIKKMNDSSTTSTIARIVELAQQV